MRSSSALDERPAFEASPAPGETLAPRRLTFGQSAVAIAYIVVALWYLIWRPSTFNPDALTFSVALYAAELFGFFTSLLHIFICWRLTRRDVATPPPGLTVDVFVTTINESPSMLRRTLMAAREMDYPHKTWLLDDGNRSEMKALAEELGVCYLARTENTDAKAGNLNNALRNTNADFVAVFDADHAPARRFLMRTLGFFQDEKVAFVQTPQDFYNLDSFQHRVDRGKRLIWNEQSIFFRVIQPGKDYWNAAFFCGSCAVLRRQALDAVNGFATETVTEDLHTSLRLHKKGYKSVYIAESLAFGISPQSLAPFFEQRMRWGRGAFQVWAKEGILFARGLTMAQRASYLATVLAYFEGWQKGFFYLAPVIVLVTAVMPINALDAPFLLHFVPYLVLSLWSFEEVGRGYGRTVLIEQFNMARFAAFLAGTFGILKNRRAFTVTSKDGNDAPESAGLAWPQQAVLFLNLAAIPFGLAHYAWYETLPLGAFVANLFWALLNAGLAGAVVSATLKAASFRRADYRFPIPLPARMKFPVDEPVYGIVDNVSSSGFRFYGRFPEFAQFGAKVTGELYLPGGAVPVQATIRSFFGGRTHKGEHYSKSVGLSFDWVGAKKEDVLDRFLYGSDLQWRINELLEPTDTPIGLLKRVLVHGSARLSSRPEHWAPVLFHSLDKAAARPEVGMISLPAQRGLLRTVVCFMPASEGTKLRVSVVTRTARQQLEGSLAAPRVFDTPLSPMYAYPFAIEDPAGR